MMGGGRMLASVQELFPIARSPTSFDVDGRMLGDDDATDAATIAPSLILFIVYYAMMATLLYRVRERSKEAELFILNVWAISNQENQLGPEGYCYNTEG